jgi:hypothetical protein
MKIQNENYEPCALGIHYNSMLSLKFYVVKGTVLRDFRPMAFFIKQSHLGP